MTYPLYEPIPPPPASWEKTWGLDEPAPTFMMREFAVSVLLTGWGTLSVARDGACTMAAAGSEAPGGGGPAPRCIWLWLNACTGNPWDCATWGCAAGIRPSPTPLAMLQLLLGTVADAVTAVGGVGEYPVPMLLCAEDGVGM